MGSLTSKSREVFNGRSLTEKTGVSAILATVDAADQPHLSFLSVGEVLVVDDAVVLNLWSGARSVAALGARRHGGLFVAVDGIVAEWRLHVTAVIEQSDPATTIFHCGVTEIREHRAPYARVNALVDFALEDPEDVLARWTRQVATMRDSLAI